MNSRNTFIVVVALFAAAAFIAGYLLRGDGTESSPTPTPTIAENTGTPTPTATPTPKPRSYVVQLTEQGPAPKSLTIRTGDTVTFRNVADIAYWPASDACSGFDALRGLQIDESYTLTFAQARTCTYSNHLDPANRSAWGTIIVQ